MNKMIKHNVPFYYDDQDKTYCFQVVIKMILKYFLPHNDYSWDDLSELTGKKEGKWTWPQYSYIKMKEIGFDVRIINLFDYDEFIENGINYIEKKYGKKIAEQQTKHCDIDAEVETIKKLKHLITKETRTAEIDDIKKALSENYLVQCSILSRHSVLVFGFDDSTIYLHDPKSSEGESLELETDKFYKDWTYPNDMAKGFCAFKL